MELKRLTKEQIIEIYNLRMVNDFPADELKPLDIILKAIDKNIYECLGLYDNEIIHGYSFLIKLQNDYLIDYLATYPEIRNQGFGAAMISLLGEYMHGANSIIGEVEDPKFASSDEERNLQTRRLNFYLRNGFTQTTIRANCFGVPFIIITLNTKLSNAEVVDKYKEIYKSHLPEKLYEENVKAWLLSKKD